MKIDTNGISGMKGKEERVNWCQRLQLFRPFPYHTLRLTFQVNSGVTAIHRVRGSEITLLSFIISAPWQARGAQITSILWTAQTPQLSAEGRV